MMICPRHIFVLPHAFMGRTALIFQNRFRMSALFRNFGYNRKPFVNKGSSEDWEKSGLRTGNGSHFLILPWFAYQSHRLWRLLPKGRKNSQRWATNLFQWLIVGGEGTQKMRDYKTFEGFFAFCSFVSWFYATFAHILINERTNGKDYRPKYWNNSLVL